MSDELRVPPDAPGPLRITWRVANNQRVAPGQVICEMETDKASVELEAPAECVIETVVESWTEVGSGEVFGRVHLP